MVNINDFNSSLKNDKLFRFLIFENNILEGHTLAIFITKINCWCFINNKLIKEYICIDLQHR